MGQEQSSKPLQADFQKTRVNFSSFTFTWVIENFSHCPRQQFLSDTFSAEGSKEKWRLSIYVGGDHQESKDYVSLYLNLAKSHRNNVSATFSILLKGDEGKSYERDMAVPQNFHLNCRNWGFVDMAVPQNFPCRSWGFTKFISHSYLLDPTNGLLPNDKLRIVCCVAVTQDTVSVTSEVPGACSLPGKDPVKPYMFHEFGECVILSVGGQEFNVYKAILSAHSPVFSATLEHDTKESETGQIVIQDTDPEVMKELLQFLYTGSAPNLKSMADRLLVLADKYQVEPLKLICEEAMCDQMSVENVCAVFVGSSRPTVSHSSQVLCCQIYGRPSSSGVQNRRIQDTGRTTSTATH